MNFTGSLPTIAALRTRRSSEIVITETKFRRTLTRLTGSGAGLRPLPALRQRFAPDGCSHATRGVAYALTQPSVRRQSTRSTRSGRFTRFWLVRPLRQTRPTLARLVRSIDRRVLAGRVAAIAPFCVPEANPCTRPAPSMVG